MRRSILVGLALLVVSLLAISVTVIAAKAQSNGQNGMMQGSTDHQNCQNSADTSGDGTSDHHGSTGHMGGMSGTNMMQGNHHGATP